MGLPLFALDAHKDLSRFSHQSWETDSGLPQNTVHSIVQTNDGYLWLATDNGLARFDGINFSTVDAQNTPALKSNAVRHLFEDRSGTLWISTAAGLTQRRGSEFNVFTSPDGMPGANVQFIYEDPKGVRWEATDQGLLRLEPNHFRTFSIQDGLSSNSINTLAADRNGSLWIGTDAGVDRLSADRIQHVISRTAVHALAFDTQRRLWVGTQSGLGLLNGQTFTKYTTKNGLPGNTIATLYEDREGSIWAGTNRGVARITSAGIQSFTPKDGLSGTLVESIFEDREGDLWLGTESGGVTVLREQRFTTYTTREGLSDDAIRTVFQDGEGIMWVGTNSGGLNRLEGERISSITTDEGLSSNIIFSLAEDPSGDMLAGTPDGLNKIHGKKISVLTSADGIVDDLVRSLYRDTDGSIWIGTRRGVTHWSTGTFTNFTQADGLGSDTVGSIVRDQDQTLWIGTLHGLSALRGGAITNYTTRHGLSSDVVTALHADRKGILWVGTGGGGLNRFQNGKAFAFPAKLGIPLEIYSILEDEKGNLWMGSRKGIVQVSKADLNSYAANAAGVVDIQVFGTADGMRISECSSGGHPAAWKATNGTLWFATLRGVSMTDPARITKNTTPPPVSIESVSIDDHLLIPPNQLVVPSGRSRLSFEYAGLSFVAPRSVRYKYKLEGFESTWTDAGARRTAFYTNVPPGNYRFRVIASNNDGVWNNTGAVLPLRIQPHFYQTYLFYLLCALVLGMLTYAAYLWRLRRVESRFQLVLAERNRIAREIHDTLAQSLVAISVQLELISRTLDSSVEVAKARLLDTRLLVKDGLNEARRSIWNLRTQAEENNDLATRLSHLVTKVAGSRPFRAHFQVRGVYRSLPETVESEFLKIAQEAMNNVVRHSNAQNVTVDLSFDPEKVRMTISDDGCGFSGEVNSTEQDGHFGLRGMRERAAQIHADLQIRSAPGGGTVISVETAIR